MAVVCCYLGLKKYDVDCLFQSEYTRDRYVEDYCHFFKSIPISGNARYLTLKEVVRSLYNFEEISSECSRVINKKKSIKS